MAVESDWADLEREEEEQPGSMGGKAVREV